MIVALRTGLCTGLILAIFLAPVLPVAAQGPVSLSVDGAQMEAFPQVKALVTVRDANGVPIIGLGADKFEIIEDGRSSFPPTEVNSQVNNDAVVSVVMVIDISGSMKGKPVEEAMRAANALLDQLGPQDRAAIIAFADKVESLDPANLEEGKELGFTTDKNAIRNVVNFLDTKIGWDTPLYDAIYKGVKMAETEPVGKRAVIVMTDGRDERDNAQGVAVKDAGSLSTPDDPINEANRFGIPIFSIGLVGLGGKIDTNYLTRLAERTGGIYQQAPQPEELTPLFQNVVDQLKTQYVLSFQSGLPKDDIFHSLMIRVSLPQGQDFDEIKFQVVPSEPAPAVAAPAEGGTEAAAPTAASQPVALPSSGEAAALSSQPAQEENSGIQGIVDTIQTTIEDQPLLAVVIGAGVLLLIILIIALIVVLLRGRRAEPEEYPSLGIEDSYSPAPAAWSPGATDAGPPISSPTFEEHTEVAPGSDWGQTGPGMPPPMPGFEPAPPAGGAGSGLPEAGGTRIIERAPKHLAMLVDKARPDRKYDLKGTTNIGRARENQLVIDHPTVSRNHAWIKSEGEDFVIFDVGSANGTFVNDAQIQEPRHLENGDVVRFGDAEFVFTKVF